MNESSLQFLICPNCQSDDLDLETFSDRHGEVWDGRLVCGSCSNWYRIERGIVDLLSLSLRRNDLYRSFAEKYELPYSDAEHDDPNLDQKLGQINFFIGDVDAYEKQVDNFSLSKALDRISFDKLQAVLGPGDLLLTVGCGQGRQSNRAAEKGYTVIGVDICEEMLRRGKELAAERGVQAKIDFIVGDAENIPVKDSIFKACLINGALHHFPSPGEAIKVASTKLRPGGSIYTMDPHDSPVRFVFDLMMKVWKLYDEEANDDPLISEEKLLHWHEQAGIEANTRLSTYLPPHLFVPLSPSLSNSLLAISDRMFNRIPYVRKLGGVIFSEGKKIQSTSPN